MQTRLLFEIGTEEIPAGYIPPALEAMRQRAGELLTKNRIRFDELRVFGTPRRMVLWISGIPERQEDLVEKAMGPPKKVAFDDEGNPTRAAEGFARRHNVTTRDLFIEETEKGPYVAISKKVPGRPVELVLEEVLPDLVTHIPFPKTMKWESSGFRFARPIRWLSVCIGDKALKLKMAGVEASLRSRGHRFLAPGHFSISSDLASYEKALENAFVIVNQEKRRDMLISMAKRAAEGVGGRLLDDQELLELNTFLVEYPYCLAGSFDPGFLSLPKEVLITVMKEHQKYFAVVDMNGDLMPHFIAVNNIVPKDPGLLKKGHERVLRARLKDAAFFYQEDTKRPFEAFVEGLSGMIFHKGLGSLLDKTRRIQALSLQLSIWIDPSFKAIVERAAYLSKADLVTEMVGEFPNLEGIMGREYALKSGEPREVAEAIHEHYLPRRARDELPASMPGAILGIADRLDTIVSTFALGMRPTGGADPYGLRRHALAILHILEEKGIELSLRGLVEKAASILEGYTSFTLPEGLVEEVMKFFRIRLKNDLVGRGLRPDTVEAALIASFDEPLDAIIRARALEAVRSREEFEPLAIAFKRVMNILKGMTPGELREDLFTEDAEKALYQGYRAVERKATPLIEERRYQEALIVLLTLKPAVDRFFDEVFVMVEEEKVRANRLALIHAISRLFLRIGDLSAISS